MTVIITQKSNQEKNNILDNVDRRKDAISQPLTTTMLSW